MFNPRLASGLPGGMPQRILPGPTAAPGAPIGNPANGPVQQMMPAPVTHPMGIQPVVRSPAGVNAGEIGTPWAGVYGSTLGRRAF